MGCDIHIVLEKKAGDRWVGVDTFRGHESALGKGYAWPTATSRNYPRFAALAGVRGEGREPQGEPSDASDTTRLLVEEFGDDGHSHSWLPLDEAARVFLVTEREEPNSFANEFPAAHYFNVESDQVDRHRLVFWFDN